MMAQSHSSMIVTNFGPFFGHKARNGHCEAEKSGLNISCEVASFIASVVVMAKMKDTRFKTAQHQDLHMFPANHKTTPRSQHA